MTTIELGNLSNSLTHITARLRRHILERLLNQHDGLKFGFFFLKLKKCCENSNGGALEAGNRVWWGIEGYKCGKEGTCGVTFG